MGTEPWAVAKVRVVLKVSGTAVLNPAAKGIGNIGGCGRIDQTNCPALRMTEMWNVQNDEGKPRCH
jgi:hypothetical protein